MDANSILVGVGMGLAIFVGGLALLARIILSSPVALAIVEGLVSSWPKETRELIRLLSQLGLKVTDDVADGTSTVTTTQTTKTETSSELANG